jgi:hypothetical protein
MDNEIIKERILKTLKDFGVLPTSRIMGIIGSNYMSTVLTLDDLEKEEKIVKLKTPSATYWKLRIRRADK